MEGVGGHLAVSAWCVWSDGYVERRGKVAAGVGVCAEMVEVVCRLTYVVCFFFRY